MPVLIWPILEAGAIFFWFFWVWEAMKNCFWDLLTFTYGELFFPIVFELFKTFLPVHIFHLTYVKIIYRTWFQIQPCVDRFKFSLVVFIGEIQYIWVEFATNILSSFIIWHSREQNVGSKRFNLSKWKYFWNQRSIL